MSVTRRSFLRSGAMTVLLTSLALDAIPQALAQGLRNSDPSHDFDLPAEARQGRAFHAKRDTFEPYVGDTFQLRAGANSVDAILEKVRDCTPSPKNKSTPKFRASDSFALVFRAEGRLTDLTTIYDIDHAALGTFALFLSPREGLEGKYYYEAVFNHAL